MTTLLAVTDEELLAGLATGERGAFERLVAVYQDRLFRLAWRVLGRTGEAEEAVQEAFVNAYRAIQGRYSQERVRALRLQPWLYRVTLNAARNQLRARRPTVSIEGSGAEAGGRMEPVDTDPRPAEEFERNELRQRLAMLLQRLPRAQREAIVLRHVEGLSYEATAGVLGRPSGTVKSDVHRGLRRLRTELGPLLEADEA